MQTITLYKYKRDDGGITVSPVMPDTNYDIMYRLIADEGKNLTDGCTVSQCVDVENVDDWTETEFESEIEEKAAAYDILTGVSE